MRPVASTAVASMHSMPAPDNASVPRCTTCHSLALPSSEEYWHIGDTTTRLGRVTPRSVIGENSMLMGISESEGGLGGCRSSAHIGSGAIQYGRETR